MRGKFFYRGEKADGAIYPFYISSVSLSRVLMGMGHQMDLAIFDI
jgi:hypothetical protein